MDNLTIINNTDSSVIRAALEREGIESGHFTNGTYAYAAEMIVPTTIAGFNYLNDQEEVSPSAFIIAVNSDVSMKGVMDANNASDQERYTLENQQTRALKVAKPLADEFPNRSIIIMFYDEDTPTVLYNHLAETGFGMRSLHKWGYGTDPKLPKIEGAHNFGQVFAFPLPNDTKPVCYDLTVAEDQSDVVQVVKLTETVNNAGQAYFPAPRNNL